MRDPMFSGFLLLDAQTSKPVAGGRKRQPASASASTDQPNLEQSLQVVMRKLSARFSEGDDDWRSAIISTLESTIEGRSAVLSLAPDVAGLQQEMVREFLEKVIRVGDTLERHRQEAAIAKLADVMIPDEMGYVRGLLASDNLKLRDQFLARVPCLTSKEIGQSAGHSESNPHATAARWKRSNEVFSVHHRGAEHFPAFQFRDDGRPHPTVKKALAALPGHLSPWQRAVWFVSTNGWLNDAAPADVLDDQDAVVAAARREVEEVVG